MELRWARPALRDLEAIVSHIRLDKGESATRVAAKLFASVEFLTRFPNQGRLGVVPGTRELVVTPWPYIVVYELLPEESASSACATHRACGRE